MDDFLIFLLGLVYGYSISLTIAYLKLKDDYKALQEESREQHNNK